MFWLPVLDVVILVTILLITFYAGMLLFKNLSLRKANNKTVNILKWLGGYSVLTGVLLFNLILISDLNRPSHVETVTLSEKTFYLYHDGWFGDDVYTVRTRTNFLPITEYVYTVSVPTPVRPKFTQKGDIIFFDGTKIYNLGTEKIIDEQLDNLMRTEN